MNTKFRSSESSYILSYNNCGLMMEKGGGAKKTAWHHQSRYHHGTIPVTTVPAPSQYQKSQKYPSPSQYHPSTIPAPTQYHLSITTVTPQCHPSTIPVPSQYHLSNHSTAPVPTQYHSSTIPQAYRRASCAKAAAHKLTVGRPVLRLQPGQLAGPWYVSGPGCPGPIAQPGQGKEGRGGHT